MTASALLANAEKFALPQPYLVFLGDTSEPAYAKTAFGLRDWAGELCVGEYGISEDTLTIGLPSMTPTQAHAAGAKSMLIGVANAGGVIPQNWMPALREALNAGLSLISGLHTRLASISELRDLAERTGQQLIDIREPPTNLSVGSGRKRSGNRLLTVGTDCALGKKYTALAISRAMSERGINIDFRATGQTGIMIAGGGIPLDAVISDFESGAAEMLSPDAAKDHWDVIEGQGSLFHPAYAAVSLGLLHGSQPDLFVVCHDPSRTKVLGHPEYALPTIEEVIELTITLGKRTNPLIRCAGAAFNTSSMEASDAEQLMARESERLGIPVADPVRGGDAFDRLIDTCLGAE